MRRQYTGTASRIENAQVSMDLPYGSSRGRTLIDRELHLGRVWAGTTAAHESRCAGQGVPPERATTVATRPELARRMLERALNACAPFTYFLADEAYGQCRDRARRDVRAPLMRRRREGAARVRLGRHQLDPIAEDFERHLLICRSTVSDKKNTCASHHRTRIARAHSPPSGGTRPGDAVDACETTFDTWRGSMRFKRVSVAAAVAALSVGALASGASPAGATAGDGATVSACYDTQTFFSKPEGGYTYPYSSSELRTSSACKDINIKLDVGAEVRVCFRSSTGCQDRFTWAARGKWTAIATNVRDNVQYNFQFTNEWDQSGYIAD